MTGFGNTPTALSVANLSARAKTHGSSWSRRPPPRGPITVDASSRDIVQNISMRKVERIGGELYDMEFETVPNVRDPAR